MNNNFLDYSKYYDLLYKDKDYEFESNFILNLLKSFHPKAESILNLGCGTGRHDKFFSDAGFDITGIDQSEEMIHIAKANVSGDKVKFITGDAKSFRASKKFDVVISLFHVTSYQTQNEDLLKFFTTIKQHLKDDGIAIIDYWHAPAVLTDLPKSKNKKVESDLLTINRKTTVTVDFTRCIANIHFDMTVEDKVKTKTFNFAENHKMRFLSVNEIECFALMSKLKVLEHFSWLSIDKVPDESSWYAYSILKNA